MRYIHLSAILIVVFIPSTSWALPLLATIQLLFTVIFYWLMFGLASGLKRSSINTEMDTPTAWTSRIIQTTATIVLLSTFVPAYQAIAIFTLPWIIINLMTDILATMVKWGIVEIKEQD